MSKSIPGTKNYNLAGELRCSRFLVICYTIILSKKKVFGNGFKRKTQNPSGGVNAGRILKCQIQMPWEYMASATLRKPAMFAPATRLSSLPYSLAAKLAFLYIFTMMS